MNLQVSDLFDCPSTNKRHMEGVAPSKTISEAMAWRNEEAGFWESLKPLENEF